MFPMSHQEQKYGQQQQGGQQQGSQHPGSDRSPGQQTQGRDRRHDSQASQQGGAAGPQNQK